MWHCRITSRWPQASGQSSEYAVYSFLRNYRQTPHSRTDRAPGHVALGRAVVDAIPHHRSWIPDPIDADHVYQRRLTTNRNASCQRRARTSDLRAGDQVLLIELSRGSKFRMPFGLKPWTIVRRNGLVIVAQRGTEVITRNISLFKKSQPPPANRLVPDIPSLLDDQVSLPGVDDCSLSDPELPDASPQPIVMDFTPACIPGQVTSTDRSRSTHMACIAILLRL
ncbi:hypothetical protein NDU88_003978 [Pleurodeles waltl]|uniref:Uncharacterized protein n=1 Tax=Pleurodeles waltl TaxID=8319 RepID=A0AAV7W3P1_PLEWA|nr:hypothetical protein NDU88_003978 [Pleurodeles waltl]